ncbi:MAG: hypothetical protein QOC92_4852 [Acidimicrobiaceae bacterium]|jgi:hypothetical protein
MDSRLEASTSSPSPQGIGPRRLRLLLVVGDLQEPTSEFVPQRRGDIAHEGNPGHVAAEKVGATLRRAPVERGAVVPVVVDMVGEQIEVESLVERDCFNTRQIQITMGIAALRRLTGLDEPVLGVEANGLEEPIARRAKRFLHRDERLGDERAEKLFGARFVADRGGRGGVERSGEHGQPT